jgi:hypothetical protein
MQSSSFICVREQRQSAKSSLKIFDLRRGIEVSEKPMAAEAALMNPEKPHLALRGKAPLGVRGLTWVHFSWRIDPNI